MKRVIQKWIAHIVENDIIWQMIDSTVLRVARNLEWLHEQNRNLEQKQRIAEAVKCVCSDLIVRDGPFKGMKYPESESIGSALCPKLLGTYENEIRHQLEQICKNEYTEIVNIGCGEGYYAVGFAMLTASAKVYAFDTNPEAIRLCRDMARLNGVNDRFSTGSFCDSSTLKAIPITKRGIVICDCEGYEKELFNEEVVRALSNCDLLVEVHDYYDMEISDYIRRLFGKTHTIEATESIDDIKKALTYQCEEIERFDLATKKKLLAEFRPAMVEWFYMTPRRVDKIANMPGFEPEKR